MVDLSALTSLTHCFTIQLNHYRNFIVPAFAVMFFYSRIKIT